MKALIISIALCLFCVFGCSAPQIPEPVFTTIDLDVPDTCMVILDGLEFGYGPMSLIVLENYPNYLQVGDWKFVLLSPVTYDHLEIE